MPHALFLVPGFGAQGGKAADLRGAFDERGGGAVINSSRAIIFAYENPRYATARCWQTAVEQATGDAIGEIGEVLS
jgi:orotidine-5'-phosphate decarboxylase